MIFSVWANDYARKSPPTIVIIRNIRIGGQSKFGESSRRDALNDWPQLMILMKLDMIVKSTYGTGTAITHEATVASSIKTGVGTRVRSKVAVASGLNDLKRQMSMVEWTEN